MTTLPMSITLEDGMPVPEYALPGDAGADLRSTINLTLHPGERALVPTGVAIQLPDGLAGFLHPRSGLAIRDGLSIINTPGTIDAGYRGEIQVPLINHDKGTPIHIRRGDRIAQLIIQPVIQAQFIVVGALDPSDRDTNGFGSTGR